MIFSHWMDTLLRQARTVIDREPPPLPPPPPPDPEWLAARARAERAVKLFERLHVVGGKDRGAAIEAAWEIARVLRLVPPGGLPRVDEEFREAMWKLRLQELPHWLNPASVAALEAPEGALPWVLGLVALHPSGYVREAAVRRLAELEGGEELRFLLVRANDWVAPVRRRAARAVEARLAPGYEPHFVACLPLVLRLEETRRGERALSVGVLELLRSPAARPALEEGLRSPYARVRRASFGLLSAEAPPEELRDVVMLGLGSPDLVVRTKAARAAYRLEVREMAEVLPAVMRAGPARVRLDGLLLAAKVGPAGEPWIRAAALDPNALVRTGARAMMASVLRVKDFAALYRAALEAGDAPRAAAVAGLGETGTAADLAIVERYLADPLPRVRLEAVDAALRLGRDAAVPAVARLLADPSPKVSRRAAEGLERRPVGPAALEPLFAGAHPSHVRRNALMLLGRRSRWEAIPWIVRACVDGDEGVAEAGRWHLRRWRARFNRASFETPTPEQRARLGAVLDAALETGGERLPAEDAAWLRGLVEA